MRWRQRTGFKEADISQTILQLIEQAKSRQYNDSEACAHVRLFNSGTTSKRNLRVKCLDCGMEFTLFPVHKKALKHGLYNTSEYQSWVSMKGRCFDQKDSSYHRYGARGITVCDRWRKSFEDFFIDMGPKPTPQHSLDRYPNKAGNYEPGNVRWATKKEQTENRANTVYLTLDGETKTLTSWAEQYGISDSTLYCRVVLRKWNLRTALTTPPKNCGKRASRKHHAN